MGRGGVRAHHHWSPSAPANTQNSMADFKTEEKIKTHTSSATSGRILRKLYDENEINTGDLQKEDKTWRKLVDGNLDILARRVGCTGRILMQAVANCIGRNLSFDYENTCLLNAKMLAHLLPFYGPQSTRIFAHPCLTGNSGSVRGLPTEIRHATTDERRYNTMNIDRAVPAMFGTVYIDSKLEILCTYTQNSFVLGGWRPRV